MEGFWGFFFGSFILPLLVCFQYKWRDCEQGDHLEASFVLKSKMSQMYQQYYRLETIGMVKLGEYEV